MKYDKIVKGKFIDRPNRFIAHVEVCGQVETVHVKNTGRCKEILKKNCTVILAESDNPDRKTKYDLVAAYKEDFGLINIDSQAPNAVEKEWLLKQDYDYVKPEYVYGNSRIDFYMEKGGEKYLMEVKGCTQEINGVGYFPDAPSERGVKHLRELAKAVAEGYHAILCFVIQMEGINEVRPNIDIQPEFGEALESAKASGVQIWFMQCSVNEDRLEIASVNANTSAEAENKSDSELNESKIDENATETGEEENMVNLEGKTTLTLIGHASVKITAQDGTTIFIDPQYYKWDYKSENADFILVTHGHDDHKPSNDLKLKDGGHLITYKEALHDGVYETYDYGNVKIEAVPAANENHDINYNVGYLVTVDGITFYHAADTSMIEQMKDLADREIDYAMYPIDGIYNMGPEEATECANLVSAKHNIPIHDLIDTDNTKFDRFTPEGKLMIAYGETIEVNK